MDGNVPPVAHWSERGKSPRKVCGRWLPLNWPGASAIHAWNGSTFLKISLGWAGEMAVQEYGPMTGVQLDKND